MAIILEYFDQINENPFVLGVVIETAVTDIRGTHWYALDGKRIADITFLMLIKEMFVLSARLIRNNLKNGNREVLFIL